RADRRHRIVRQHLQRVMGAGRRLRDPSHDLGVAAQRPVRSAAMKTTKTMKMPYFIAAAALVACAGLVLPQVVPNPFFFRVGYFILQYVVLATGWNILGGYAGYTNFGASAFYGAGAYTAALLLQAFAAPMIVQILGAALFGVVLGVATGYLTLRVQGV